MLTPSRQSCPPSAPDPLGQMRTAFLKTLSHPSSLEALNSWHMAEATTLEGRSGPALAMAGEYTERFSRAPWECELQPSPGTQERWLFPPRTQGGR